METHRPNPKGPTVIAKGSTARTQRAERIDYPENPRYRRVRSLSVLMDQSIVLPNGYRIGLDPLVGLLPGVGDAVTALVSCYLIYESARLGVKKRVLFRMLGNITLEAIAGAVPILGDIFDATWKANMRNLRLLEQHYHPSLKERSARSISGWMIGVSALLLLLIGSLFYGMAQLIFSLSELLF